MPKTVSFEMPDHLYKELMQRVGNDQEGLRLLFVRALARDEFIQKILPKQFFYFWDNEYHPVDFSFNLEKFRKTPKRK